MHISGTPTDEAFRRTLIAPTPDLLEDWALSDLSANQVDWLGWLPEQAETLFKPGNPEALFLAHVLGHDRQAQQWRQIVGQERTTWLHALIDTANEHPKSPLLRQAIDVLASRITNDRALDSTSWGADGVAERVLVHLARHPRRDAGGNPRPVPPKLRTLVKKAVEHGGPSARLALCGQAYDDEEQALVTLRLATEKPIVQKQDTPASPKTPGWRGTEKMRQVLDAIAQDLAQGEVAPSYKAHVPGGSLDPVYTIQALLNDQAPLDLVVRFLDTPEKCQARFAAIVPREQVGKKPEAHFSAVWLAGHHFSEAGLPKLMHVLDGGADPGVREGRNRETSLHRLIGSDNGAGEAFDRKLLLAAQRMVQVSPGAWLATDTSKMTPLMRAIRKGKADLVAWMVEDGPTAQLRVRDCLGHTVAHAIVQSFPPQAAQGLLALLNTKRAIDWAATNAYGETPLAQALRRPQDERIQWRGVAQTFGQALDEAQRLVDGHLVFPKSGMIVPKPGREVRIADHLREGQVLVEDEGVGTLIERAKDQERDRTLTWSRPAPRR